MSSKISALANVILFLSGMRNWLLTILLLHGITQTVFSQKPVYTNFEKFDSEDGLPQNHINSIAQDKDGFMWFATPSGLARFDGKDFIQFGAEKQKPYQLSSSNIRDILIDEENRLWIVHINDKVDIMDPQTFSVSLDVAPTDTVSKSGFLLELNGSIRWIIGSKKAGQWFIERADQYALFDDSNPKLKRLFHQKHQQSRPNHRFHIDQEDESLWIVKQDGILRYDSSWAKANHIELPLDLSKKGEEISYSFLVSPDSNRLLLAGIKEFYDINRPNQHITKYELPDVSYLWHKGMLLPTGLKRTGKGDLIFAYQGYVYQLDIQTLKVTLLWQSDNSDLLPVSSLFLTKNNTLWIGVSGDGLYKVDLNVPSFRLVKYEQNYIVDILKETLKIDQSTIPKNWNVPSFPYGLRTFNRGDTMFIVNEFGFGSQRRAYYTAKGAVKPMIFPETDDKSCFFGFAGDSQTTWAIDRDGWLFQWDSVNAVPHRNQVIPINSSEERDDTKIVDLASDDQSHWIITKPGVLFQIQSGKLVNTYYPGSGKSTFVSIKQDPVEDSILWIGSLGDGLIRWNKQAKRTTYRFSKQDGLADNKIASLVFDEADNLWLSTFNGISKYNRKTASFISYGKSDGLQQTEFNRHHAFLLPDGRISFGGSLGYIIFDPSLFNNDLSSPYINISTITINGDHPAFSADSIYLNAPINTLTDLRLPYHKNSFTIGLASSIYNTIAETKYRYRISDYTNGWVDLNNQRTVRVDQLPPGEYIFTFNVSNSRGVWSKHHKVINLTIDPPPWLTWWAFVLYLGLAVLLAFFYWKNYKRKLIRQQEEVFNKREAKRLAEIDEMKTRFFSNITHEFRTPLTLILSPIEKQLQSTEVTGKIRKVLETSYNNANQLLGLVNQLLDIAKIESGHMQSHQSLGDLAIFMEDIVCRFEEEAMQKGIRLHFEAHNADGTYELDKMNLEKVVQNLLSNAVKFTPTGGDIQVTVAVESTSTMHLVVKDTGPGIKPEVIPHLFDRFYQADDQTTRAHEGTGIGLALVKELVELMEGSVSVESTYGQGACFKIAIPVTKPATTEEPKPETPSWTKDSKIKHSSKTNLLILVVEDNDELREFLVESLTVQYTVLGASNGEKGWKMIQEEMPDLVISDLMMPQMNGLELCKLAKTDLRTAHIQFIMLTAKASQESKEQGLDYGVDEYLTKPFHFRELEMRIANFIQGRSHLQRHLMTSVMPGVLGEKPQKVNDVFVERLLAFVDQHLQDSDLDATVIAEAMDMSVSTLNRKMKSTLDTSINKFIRNYRLEKSTELIRAGHTIAETAYRTGFQSPSYYTHCFKEYFTKSPSEYQKEAS